jgi:Immunoglobulin-like domain of bacterial spore germination
MYTKRFLFIVGVLIVVGIVFLVTTHKTQAPVLPEQPIVEEPTPPSPEVVKTDDRIVVTSPKPGEAITSPLTITGEARGYWFFEASFPVVLVNWDGLIIAQGIAEAEGNWMTESFVPFTAKLTFIKPDYNERGTLILQKDNPSGLPENDAAVEIPVTFK